MRTRILLSLVLLSGCGGGGSAFGPTYPDNRQSDLDAVTARLSEAPPPDAPILVGISSSPRGLYAYDLNASRVLWNEPVELGTVPHLAGDYVVSEEGEDAVVRRLSDGTITSRVPRRGLRLVGAAGEGSVGALVLSTTGGAVAESILVLLSRGGVSHRYEVDQALGEPAVRAAVLFVPWGHQNVSAIDALTGTELARLRVREVVGHAVAYGNQVFVGQSALARFSAQLTSDPAWLEPSEFERSAGTSLFDDAYAPPPAAVSAAHRVRMAFAPVSASAEHGAGFEDGALYEIFYRAIFALEGAAGEARWTNLTQSDVVGAAVSAEGLIVVDDQGRLTLLDATDGRARWSGETGIPSSYAALRVEGLSVAGAPRGDSLSLPDQLLTVASDTDARLVPARAFAVRLLGGSPDPSVTAHLISLCEDGSAAPAVHVAACDTLGNRTVGGDQVVQGLQRHAAFLTGTSAPPVGPLARAALAMGERRAVPLLLTQLTDPGTLTSDLPSLLEALGGFGDATALAPLADWLRLYHAESDDSGMGEALAAGVRAYGQLAGPTASDLLQPLLADPLTHPLLRAAAEAVLAPPSEDAAPEESEGDAFPEASAARRPDPRTASAASTVLEGGSEVRSDAPPPAPVPALPTLTPPTSAALPVDPAEGRAVAEAERERRIAERAAAARAAAATPSRDDELPPHLTTEMIDYALRDFRVALRACLVTDRLTHARARVVLVIEPSGALAMVSVTPTELQGCVEPLIRSTPYPATSGRRRQTVAYEIRR